MNVRDVGRAMLAGVTLPWAGFVAGFVYFVILTAIVIGGIDLSWQVLALAYLLPVAGYAALLLSRAAHTLASLEIGLHHVPHAVIR